MDGWNKGAWIEGLTIISYLNRPREFSFFKQPRLALKK